MAPPRQRTTAVQDDSRSEASSTTTRELKAAATKSRKGANGVTTTTVSREVKVTTNVTSAPATQGEQPDLPGIPWSEMPLDFLHSYRHAYKLNCPSAHSSEYSHSLLSRGIGLLSPTAIAAQRAQSHGSQQTNGSSRQHHSRSRPNGIGGGPHNPSYKKSNTHGGKSVLDNIVGQDRVAKTQLATAVRKHFNSAGLVEQEAIARFLYKVREEGRGRHFRLKFQP